MKKHDDIQLASIRRSEAYLRKKALERDTKVHPLVEGLAGALFGLVMISLAIIILSL